MHAALERLEELAVEEEDMADEPDANRACTDSLDATTPLATTGPSAADLLAIPTERAIYATGKGASVHTVAFRPSPEASSRGRVCAELRRPPRSARPGPASSSSGGGPPL